MTKLFNIQTTNGNFRRIEVDGVTCHIGESRTVDEYIEECLHGGNECAELISKIKITKSGKDAIVWYDGETGETFISY